MLHGHGKTEQRLGMVVVPLGIGAMRHGRWALRRGEAPDRRRGCGAGAQHAASVEIEWLEGEDGAVDVERGRGAWSPQ